MSGKAAETPAALRNHPGRVTPDPGDIEQLIHKLRVHQVELEMQNEELRRSHGELDAARLRYFDLYDLAPIGYLTVSENGLIREANLTAAVLLGVERGELYNTPKSRFIFTGDQEAYYLHRKKVLENSERQAMEIRMVRADGTLFWAQLHGIPADKGEYWVAFFDISERKRADIALQISARNLNATLNTTADGILAVDPDGKVLFLNRRFAELWKIPQTVLDSDDDNTMIHHVLGQLTDPDAFINRIRQLYNSVESSFDTLLFKDGRIFERFSSPMLEDNSLLLGRVWSFRDVTERKRAEEELRQAKERLEERVSERTNELVRSLEQTQKATLELAWAEERERERIAGELHDQVGQSLLLAKMKLDALAEKTSTDPSHGFVQDISVLIENTIHDIRTLTFRMRPPVLGTAGIETTLEWLSSTLKSDYGLTVEFSTDSHPKPLPDEVKYSLYKAVRELLLNVAKHAGTSKAKLVLKAEERLLSVCVVDEGAGFNYSDATLHDADKKNYGLFSVQQRIVRMGGSFTVESAPGGGTSVTLTVQLSEV